MFAILSLNKSNKDLYINLINKKLKKSVKKITQIIDDYLNISIVDKKNKDEIYDLNIHDEYNMFSEFIKNEINLNIDEDVFKSELYKNNVVFKDKNRKYFFRDIKSTYGDYVKLSYRQYKSLLISILNKINPNYLIEQINEKETIYTDIKTENELNKFNQNEILVLILVKEKNKKVILSNESLSLDKNEEFIQNISYDFLEKFKEKNINLNNFILDVFSDFYENKKYNYMIINVDKKENEILETLQLLKM